MRRFFCFFAVSVFLGLVGLVHAADFEVSPSADNDCSDFICDLQSALHAAEANGQDNTIHLAGDSNNYDASGGSFTYLAANDTSLTLVGDGADQTFVDGGGVNTPMVMDTTALSADSLATISIQNITFQNGSSTTNGGGLQITTNDADIKIDHCDFRFNKTTVPVSGNTAGGGGLFAFAGNFGSVRLTNNNFSHNFAPSAAGGSLSGSLRGDVLLEGNTYIENTTLDVNPTADTIGGGAVIVAVIGTLNADRNLFLKNSAAGGGGLVAVAVGGSGVVTNNIIADNSSIGFSAPSSTSALGGAGLVVVPAEGVASIDVTNNTIVGNKTVNGDGGGLLVFMSGDGTHTTLTNNIVWGNTATGSQCSTGCDDIAVKDNADGNNVGSTTDVSHNDFSDISFDCDFNAGCTPHQNVDGATNLHEDPLFVDANQADFHLTEASPLINKGTSSAPSLPDNDFEGNPRIQGSDPDMGALESPFSPVTTTENCANNVDDDGDGKIDCLDPDCAGAAACLNSGGGGSTGGGTGGTGGTGGIGGQGGSGSPGGTGGTGGNGGPGGSGGCSMTEGTGSPFFMIPLLIPLLWVTRRFLRRP
jgi:hypothetical protein